MKNEMQAQPADKDQKFKCVTFCLDDETYGINVLQVREVLRMTDIAPVPGAPDKVLGVINLRGSVVTVVDARKSFRMAARPVDEAARIIVVEVDEHVVGLSVDAVAEVLELTQSMVESAPNVGNEENSKYIDGVVNHPTGILILIDVRKMLNDDEWEELAQV
ncbi:MAG: chemotaxis protein CheW [Porticoccaceae bacterium]|nr:MAG: chemotaxis protein CheW [Porticoccaceae bacterium]